MVSFSGEVRAIRLAEEGYRCQKCGLHITQVTLTFHHGIENTKVNREIFGAILQSHWNCYVLCHNDHNNYAWEHATLRRGYERFYKERGEGMPEDIHKAIEERNAQKAPQPFNMGHEAPPEKD